METDEHGRVEPPVAGDELATLRGFLTHHRQTLRWKTSGLDREQLLTTHPPSSMTLLGMVKHLAYVEDHWFSTILLGEEQDPWSGVDWRADEDWDWHSAALDDVEHVMDLWEAAVARSDAALVNAADGLETRAVRRPRWAQEPLGLRWIVVHMIEEYARHNGHADLLREAVDGTVGE